jgi:hypothetical protein
VEEWNRIAMPSDFVDQDVLSVDMCLTVRGECPVTYLISGGLIEFSFGGPRDGFNVAVDTEALGKLVTLGSQALAALAAPPTCGCAGVTAPYHNSNPSDLVSTTCPAAP